MLDRVGPRHCFVFGCPRSGTSALTRLLHQDDRVVMGMERYKDLLLDPDGRAGFSPDLFEPARFLDFRPGDTNITPDTDAGRYVRHYARAERRFREGTVEVVGDKVRAQDLVTTTVAERVPDARFVFIYRDLLRVASSFEARAANVDDTGWAANRGYRRALQRWNMAFAAADELLDRVGAPPVFVVRYERLFNGDEEVCAALFAFLGLDLTPVVRRRFAQMTDRWEQRAAEPLGLEPDQQAYLRDHADQTVLERFDARFTAQRR
jgi:hypothetical protein